MNTMTPATLYLIQSNYVATAQSIEQLAQIYAPDDQVVLLGEAVLAINHDFIQSLAVVYVLENDAELLTQPYASNVKIIDYADFAALCLAFSRCVSMK